MFYFSDLLESAVLTIETLPEANIAVRLPEGVIAIHRSWVTVLFILVPGKLEKDVIMDVQVHSDVDNRTLSADIVLEGCFNCDVPMLANIASTTFEQIVNGYNERREVLKVAKYIEQLFLGIDVIITTKPKSKPFHELKHNLTTLNHDGGVGQTVMAGDYVDSAMPMLYLSVVNPDNVPKLTVCFSEQQSLCEPILLISLNWVTLSGDAHDLESWYIPNWDEIDSKKLFKDMMTRIQTKISNTAADVVYDGVTVLFERLMDIYATVPTNQNTH